MDEHETSTERTETEQAASDELATLREELSASRARERETVERLKVALIAVEPALEPGMLPGETLAEVEASFANATTMLEKVRQRAAAHAPARVPAGAPGRQARYPRTPFEKIRDGLSKLDG